jgi:hypothetical protein
MEKTFVTRVDIDPTQPLSETQKTDLLADIMRKMAASGVAPEDQAKAAEEIRKTLDDMGGSIEQMMEKNAQRVLGIIDDAKRLLGEARRALPGASLFALKKAPSGKDTFALGTAYGALRTAETACEAAQHMIAGVYELEVKTEEPEETEGGEN